MAKCVIRGRIMSIELVSLKQANYALKLNIFKMWIIVCTPYTSWRRRCATRVIWLFSILYYLSLYYGDTSVSDIFPVCVPNNPLWIRRQRPCLFDFCNPRYTYVCWCHMIIVQKLERKIRGQILGTYGCVFLPCCCSGNNPFYRAKQTGVRRLYTVIHCYQVCPPAIAIVVNVLWLNEALVYGFISFEIRLSVSWAM